MNPALEHESFPTRPIPTPLLGRCALSIRAVNSENAFPCRSHLFSRKASPTKPRPRADVRFGLSPARMALRFQISPARGASPDLHPSTRFSTGQGAGISHEPVRTAVPGVSAAREIRCGDLNKSLTNTLQFKGSWSSPLYLQRSQDWDGVAKVRGTYPASQSYEKLRRLPSTFNVTSTREFPGMSMYQDLESGTFHKIKPLPVEEPLTSNSDGMSNVAAVSNLGC